MSVTVVVQRRLALEMANEQRIAAAALKRDIAACSRQDAQRMVADLLEDGARVVGAMRLGGLLGSVHGVGDGALGRWLCAAGVRSADRRVDSLTDRQLRILIDILRGQR